MLEGKTIIADSKEIQDIQYEIVKIPFISRGSTYNLAHFKFVSYRNEIVRSKSAIFTSSGPACATNGALSAS